IAFSTNSPSGNKVLLQVIDQSTGYATGNGNVLITPPNDTLFFVANTPESTSPSANYADLTEFGYIPVYCQSTAITMRGGAYYLLRHQTRSNASGTSWDFWDPARASDWWTTPGIGTTVNVPILDNVLRFY